MAVFCFLVSPVLIKPPDFHKFFPAFELEKCCDFLMETPQTMRSIFRLALSADLPLFQLLTVFSWCSVCPTFQPLQQLIFHHQFAPVSYTHLTLPIRKVGKSGLLKRLYAPALEICNASASCFTSITSGMASNGSLLIKSPFPHEKAAATISVTAAASASVYLSKYF